MYHPKLYKPPAKKELTSFMADNGASAAKELLASAASSSRISTIDFSMLALRGKAQGFRKVIE